MTTPTSIFYILINGIFAIVSVVGNTSLIALSKSEYALELYLRLRNQDGSTSMDPVISGAQTPERVCKDIGANGFFRLIGFSLVNIDEEFPGSEGSHEYANPYELREFNVLDSMGSHDLKEYVLRCPPLRDFFIGDERPVIYYHVSREYNVSPVKELYKPGRFVFANLIPEVQTSYNYMILAEEPASAYKAPGFNVESHYIQLRKYVRPAKIENDDPLCKLISVTMYDPRDQCRRLCVAVSKSSYFNRELTYPDRRTQPCFVKEVSFKTEEGMKKAPRKLYQERMILCNLSKPEDFFYSYENFDYEEPQDDEEELIFISRAYLTNAVYVYRPDSTNGKVYLENLSTNISIVDEVNSFEFVEF